MGSCKRQNRSEPAEFRAVYRGLFRCHIYTANGCSVCRRSGRRCTACLYGPAQCGILLRTHGYHRSCQRICTAPAAGRCILRPLCAQHSAGTAAQSHAVFLPILTQKSGQWPHSGIVAMFHCSLRFPTLRLIRCAHWAHSAPAPLPNRFTFLSYSVLTARCFTQFSIIQKAANRPLFALDTKSNSPIQAPKLVLALAW